MSRYYPYKGVEYASVTTITGIWDKSNGLLPWAVNCAMTYIANILDDCKEDSVPVSMVRATLEAAKQAWRTVKGEAADLGSATHEYVERYIKGHKITDKIIRAELESQKFPPDNIELVINGFNMFLEWAVNHNLEVIESEKTVYNEAELYAGTMDLKARLDGKVTVIDLKTSKGIYPPEPYMQLAAYARADGNEDVERAIVLHLDKVKGIVKPIEITGDLDYHFKGFLHARSLFYMYSANKAVKNVYTEKFYRETA